MIPKREAILSDALKLPEGDREVLVDELLASLTRTDGVTPASEWSDVVARRLHEIDEGRVRMVPGDEVLEKLRGIAHGRAR
jgi:putative addiction module component (TIGR02574 family)